MRPAGREIWPGGAGLAAKSCLTLVTLWTVAHQASLSTGLPRQEHWSGLPFPPAGELKPASPALQPDSLPRSQQGSRGDQA